MGKRRSTLLRRVSLVNNHPHLCRGRRVTEYHIELHGQDHRHLHHRPCFTLSDLKRRIAAELLEPYDALTGPSGKNTAVHTRPGRWDAAIKLKVVDVQGINDAWECSPPRYKQAHTQEFKGKPQGPVLPFRRCTQIGCPRKMTGDEICRLRQATQSA